MDPRAESLLRRFADVESGEEVVTIRRGAGRPTETIRRQHARVTALRPEEGVVEIAHGNQTARVHLTEAELLRLLDEAGRNGSDPWGEPLPAEESAARLLSVWLDESLGTRDPHPSGWWTCSDGGFDPVPPWEAHRRRRSQS